MRLSFLVPLLASAAISSAAMASDDQQSAQHRWQRSSQSAQAATSNDDSPRAERSGWGRSRASMSASSGGGGAEQSTVSVEQTRVRSGGWGGRERAPASTQGTVGADTMTSSDSGFQSRLQAYRQSHQRTGSAWAGKDRSGMTTPITTDTARTSHHRDGSRYNWSSTDWRRDTRYDWNRYRDHHRSIFQLGIYYDPYGYNYRRFDIGYSMWPNYYQSSYWIQDPWMYRLPPVYGPYRWVRYWDDALLVDTWSGEVVDVIHNFFW